MKRILTLADLDRASWGLAQTLQDLASRFGSYPSFDEEYKLAQFPNLTEENIAQVHALLSQAVDLLEKTQVRA